MFVAPELQKAIEECISRSGARLIELVARGSRGHPIFEVYVDSVDGVTLEFCSALSRAVQSELGSHGFIGDYGLTVSSPGIDRPLKFPWQYRKHLGRTLEIKERSNEVISSTTGKLMVCDESGVVLETVTPGQEKRFGFDDIVEARVRTPW